ncbi:hypothetical protein PV10_07483 [Exophiala mesophila]|uniref:Xylanolytic transcriptional activator regulatory domain-containing protein n=1 Tax=Exophiala mesophila TaxID=212818 RepID=A0A0D1ZTM8_EXOME|nr:uncharacterized protein PV10_07483 [Exophiala mesophila]KIV90143.1 hypothetical protein PV10_07483 [Exophiala mesophila]
MARFFDLCLLLQKQTDNTIVWNCSGEDVCSQCHVRGASCIYDSSYSARTPNRTTSTSESGVRQEEEDGSLSAVQPLIIGRNRESIGPNRVEFNSLDIPKDANSEFAQRRPIDGSEHSPEQSLPETLASKGETVLSASLRQEEPPIGADLHDDLLSPVMPRSHLTTMGSQNTQIRDPGEKTTSPICQQPQDPRGYPKRYCKSTGLDSPCPQPYSLRLPPPLAATKLIDYYFQEVNPLFPILDQTLTSSRIEELLGEVVDQGTSQIIQVSLISSSLSILLCSILALAEQLSKISETSDGTKSGWEMYLQAEALCLHFGHDEEALLDIIKYHTLSARFLLSENSFHKAAKHASTAIRLAYDLQLNIQDSWPDCSSLEFSNRKRVWWALYVLDQQVSRRSGRPYLISEREVSVGKLHHGDAHETGRSRDATNDDQGNTSFLQALVDLSMIYRQIWDNFCSATASERSVRSNTAVFDQQLLRLQSRLRPKLQRDPPSMCQAEKVTRINTLRQFVLAEEINLLRLWIRRSPSMSNMDYDSLLVSISLIERNIRDLVTLADGDLQYSLIGFYLSSPLAENVGQLLDICDQSSSYQSSETLRILEVGCQLLLTLSRSSPHASRAIRDLQAGCSKTAATSVILEKIWSGNDGATAENISGEPQMIHVSELPPQDYYPQFTHGGLPSTSVLRPNNSVPSVLGTSRSPAAVSASSPKDKATFGLRRTNSSEVYLPEIMEDMYGELDFR